MRTTLDLPEELIMEALNLTHLKTKTDVIKLALENLVQKEKIKELKNYFGKVHLEIDLDVLRDRHP
jgi:Arc/MetJ family transcription regulator